MISPLQTSIPRFSKRVIIARAFRKRRPGSRELSVLNNVWNDLRFSNFRLLASRLEHNAYNIFFSIEIYILLLTFDINRKRARARKGKKNDRRISTVTVAFLQVYERRFPSAVKTFRFNGTIVDVNKTNFMLTFS